jgi:hypothetical protein
MAQGASVRQYIGAAVNFNLHCLSLSPSSFRYLRLPPPPLYLLFISISFHLKTEKRNEQFSCGAPPINLSVLGRNGNSLKKRGGKNRQYRQYPRLIRNNSRLTDPLYFSLYNAFKGKASENAFSWRIFLVVKERCHYLLLLRESFFLYKQKYP